MTERMTKRRGKSQLLRGEETSKGVDVSPEWRSNVRRGLVAGLDGSLAEDDVRAAVEEILRLHLRLRAALSKRAAGERERPVEIVRDQRAKAAFFRRCAKALRAQMNKAGHPSALIAASGARRSEPLTRASPDDLAASATLVTTDVVEFLEALSTELERNPYGIPSEYLPVDYSQFYGRPSDLKEIFVGKLLLIWTRLRGERIGDLAIGSRQRGVLPLIDAACMPLKEEGNRLVSESSALRHARNLRDRARQYGEHGDEVIENLVQIVW
jgi:hypothetical protein